MLRRKYRKMPRDMQEFSKRFGWSAREASALLTQEGAKRRGGAFLPDPRALLPAGYGYLSEESAVECLRSLAGEYADWFRKEPEKTHLFPLKASIFQYWFAKGVRDALGLKARMRTIASFRTPYVGKELQLQAAKLKLGNGIVFHDFVGMGTTVENISRAAGLYSEQVAVHNLGVGQDKAGAELPVFGKKVFVKAGHVVGKKVDRTTKKVDLRPELEGLPEKQADFVKRACYAVGVASARGLLKKKK